MLSSKTPIILFIFFRDFRIIDNTTLSKLDKKKVYPIFIFNPIQIDKKRNEYFSENSVQCLCDGLKDLNNELDNSLTYFYGKTEKVLEDILDSHPEITTIAFNRDITPFARKRERLIKELCNRYEKKVLIEDDYSLLDLESIKNGSGDYYKTFFHYHKKVISRSLEIKNSISGKVSIKFSKLTNSPLTISLSEIDKYHNNKLLVKKCSRVEALKILNSIESFKDYGKKRSFPRYNTTLLSVYLKYGVVSIREVYLKMWKRLGKESDLLRQLVWKDFYQYLMWHVPVKNTIGGGNFQNKEIDWENRVDYFEKWKLGETGFPFIDACMRQLNTTGWMHNRGRLSVANFLVYTLAIDWRWGEKYFATKLVDYDISQNNGNWQWCGGVGIDRKPYLRMYNPYSLIEKYDPDCVFTKEWCPELEKVSNKELRHLETRKKPLINYPIPMVNYKERRKKAKILFSYK